MLLGSSGVCQTSRMSAAENFTTAAHLCCRQFCRGSLQRRCYRLGISDKQRPSQTGCARCCSDLTQATSGSANGHVPLRWEPSVPAMHRDKWQMMRLHLLQYKVYSISEGIWTGQITGAWTVGLVAGIE